MRLIPTWSRLCGWADQEYRLPARSLAFVRITLALYLLRPLGYPVWLSQLPDSFYKPPPGITMFFTGFPPEWVVLAMGLISTVCVLLMLFGLWTLPATLVTVALMFLNWGITFSLGKIDHGQMLPICMLALGLAGWGKAWSFDAWRRKTRALPAGEPSGWPITWLALVLSLGYFSAAIPKATSGWLLPDTHATFGYLIRFAVDQERTRPIALWLMEHPGWWWKLPDYGTVLVEAGLLFLLPRRRWFLLGLVAMLTFHWGVWVMMGIFFGSNFIAIGALYNYDRLVGHLENRLGRFQGKPWRNRWLAAPLIAASLLIAVRLNNTQGWEWAGFTLKPSWFAWMNLTVAVLVTLGAFAWFYAAYIRRHQAERLIQ
ncbi:MAG: hypothetical protein AAF797_09285 [Planctomycetota bacterium]